METRGWTRQSPSQDGGVPRIEARSGSRPGRVRRTYREATIASYEKEWVDRLRKVGSLDSQTIDGYEWKMKAIGHAIGDVKLQSLTTRDVNRCYAALRGGESPSGKPLSGTYVRDCHMVLCKMLDDAVADGVVCENVARLATPPKRDTKEKHALSDMEMRLLIAMMPTDTASSVAVILAVTTGLAL